MATPDIVCLPGVSVTCTLYATCAADVFPQEIPNMFNTYMLSLTARMCPAHLCSLCNITTSNGPGDRLPYARCASCQG